MSEVKWTNFKDVIPYEGYTGIVLITGTKLGELPKDEYYTMIATYCDGLWYKLEYDNHTGVLRKVCITQTVGYYTDYLVPNIGF